MLSSCSHTSWRVFVLLLFFTGLACAQAIFGSLQGTVSDPSGALLPKARVTFRNVATGVQTETEANDSAIYFFGDVRPGVYDLEVAAPGFSAYVQKGVTVRVEDRLRIDVHLKVGEMSQKVEVTGEAPLLQTESNTVGRVVEEKTIKQLPLRGRNAFELVLLTPGAQQRSDDEQPRLSGGLARTGEFVLDGASITDPRRGQLYTQPNLDAIQEFKVQTNGLSAEFGRLAGGIVNATLKSGTNEFRGNLFEFHRNSAINARNFFASSNPKLIQNQFGGIIGGPIIKDKVFFFADFESFRQASESLFNITIPTARMKNGDFSELLGASSRKDALGRPVLANQIFDPATTRPLPGGAYVRDPFPGNAIPTSRFDTYSRSILDLFPDPNLPGLSQNYRSLIPVGINNNKFDTRVDWRASDSDMVFGRFSWDHQAADTARPFPAASTGGARGTFDRYMTGVLSWTRTLNPTTINDARLSGFRGVQERLLSQNTGDLVNIPNLNLVGLPVLAAAGYASIGDATAFNPVMNDIQLQDVVTLVRGKHIIKAGVDFRKFIINDLQLQFTGTYNFASGQTGDPTNAATTGNSIASLLLGHANSFSNSTLRGRFYYRSLYLGAFLQDDYKVTNRLTLSLGLRYDVEQNPREIRQQGSNFDLALGRVVTMKELGRDFIQFTDRLNLGPRVGFAWQPFPSGKTVIRSHYGIFYVPLTGRATSAFSRFPADQRVSIGSDGINPAVIVSQTPAIVPSTTGIGQASDNKNEHAKLGYYEQWNFNIQHQLRSFLLEASYVGSAGTIYP